MATLKTSEEIEIMAKAGKILAEVLEILKNEAKENVSTNSLDALAKNLIEKAGAVPAFLGYRSGGRGPAFPATLCSSINEVVVHGPPSDRKLKTGDLLKLDLGLKYQGFYVDSAITISIGNPTPLQSKLMNVTREALSLAIEAAKSGNTLGDIGWAVKNYVTKNDFSVVESLTGHGIGRSLHEDPNVPNVGRPKSGEELQVGMVLAIEPMVGASPSPHGGKIKQLPDGGFATEDGSLSAHFEHTVAITKKGPRVLTKF